MQHRERVCGNVQMAIFVIISMIQWAMHVAEIMVELVFVHLITLLCVTSRTAQMGPIIAVRDLKTIVGQNTVEKIDHAKGLLNVSNIDLVKIIEYSDS